MDGSEDVGGCSSAFDDVGVLVGRDLLEGFEGCDFDVCNDHVAAEFCEFVCGFDSFLDCRRGEDVDHVDERGIHLGRE